MTQAQQLIAAIRLRGWKGMTMLELEQLKISSCPWRRLSSDERPERFLRKGERLERKTGCDGLIRFVVVKGCK